MCNTLDSLTRINKETIESAKHISLSKNCIVGISGAEDIITNGISVTHIKNGHPIMTKVTGMGCGLTSFTGAFCSVERNNYFATIAAFSLYAICGELAGNEFSNQPGSFFTKFIDTIYTIDSSSILNSIKIKTN